MSGVSANASASPMSTNPSNGATKQSNLTPLSADSPSHAFVEYFLRLSLQASTAHITAAYEISNPQLTLTFEKRSKNVLTIDSWLDVSSLTAPNSEEELVRRGFCFNNNAANATAAATTAAGQAGMKFPVGKIRLEADDSSSRGKTTKRFLLCKVAVGRAYNATEDFSKIGTIPDGYDSFLVDRKREAQPGSIDSEDKGYLFEYVIKDATQILPTFMVDFEYDPEQERCSRQKIPCENCEREPATVFCQADVANLCGNCDSSMHATKLASRHLRIALDQGPQTFSNCRTHPEKVVEFFCPSCSRPVCVHCKMVGHHSVGDAAKHKLISVAEAFRSVSDAARANDPVIDGRKATINAQLAALADRSRQVDTNAADIQTQLEEVYRKAQTDLKAIAKKKQNVLKGDTMELQRQLQEIAHLEAFLDYQQSGGNATQFILDWAHHLRLKTELHGFPFFRDTIDVQPDIKINGSIQVHVEQALAGYGMSSLNSHDYGGSHFGLTSSPLSGIDSANNKSIMSGLDSTKPRYSAQRARAPPTFDLGGKTRKASDFLTETLQSVQLGGGHARSGSGQ